MASLWIETPEGLPVRRELAGVGSRVAAQLLDLCALFLGLLVVIIPAMLLLSIDPTGLGKLFVYGLLAGVLLLIALLPIVWHLFDPGRSPGKRLLRLRVVGSRGEPVGLRSVLLRSLLLVVEVLPLPLPVPVGLIALVASTRSQRLGDLAAGTLVLREARAHRLAEPTQQFAGVPKPSPPAGAAAPATARPTLLCAAHAELLATSDLELLRGLLTRSSLFKSASGSLTRRAARLYADRLGLAYPADPRAFLRELYLHTRAHRERRARA